MPIMHVTHAEETLDSVRKAALARRLTDILIAMEGGADTAGGRAFAWVIFTPVRRGDWWIGGHVDDTFVAPPGRFLVHVTIPEGYMDARHKAEVHAAVNTAIMEEMGESGDPDPGSSILVVIDEVPEGNWGAAGRTISIASIADTVGLPKDGERFGWVRTYFEAKARQYAAAGYPAGISGLLGDR